MVPHVVFTLLAVVIHGSFARELPITIFGAKSGSSSYAVANTVAINAALGHAKAGDIVVVPEGESFWITGGINGTFSNIELHIAGQLIASTDIDSWPQQGQSKFYAHIMNFERCSNFTVSGIASRSANGTAYSIEGHGVPWWDAMLLGTLKHHRPKMIVFDEGRDITIRSLYLHNSPSFHIDLNAAGADVHDITVEVDRESVQRVKSALRQRRLASLPRNYLAASADRLRQLTGKPWSPADVLATLEPEDLNTDGIDPSGTNIWVHDCTIHNDDDSIAVKPVGRLEGCSSNITMERLVLSGFGASIGSVPPHPNGDINCVDGVVFRDISMPYTGKGIYIKSNPECTGDDGGLIANILYTNVTVQNARWWPIWIGPQQQHEPHSSLGDKCSLTWPIDSTCPTQGCIDFRNISLVNCHFYNSWMSPGVIMGNSSNPMQGITFTDVVHHDGGHFPFGADYYCKDAEGLSQNSSPKPCF